MLNYSKNHSFNRKVKKLYKLSFAKDERVSTLLLKYLLKKKESMIYSFFDENKSFIGFCYVILFKNYSYLAFFATDPNQRNKGYGKEILQILKNDSKDKFIFLSCEKPDLPLSESDIKLRRYNFYKRNGFYLVPIVAYYCGVQYLTMSSKKYNDEDLLEETKTFEKFNFPCKIDKSVLKDFE